MNTMSKLWRWLLLGWTCARGKHQWQYLGREIKPWYGHEGTGMSCVDSRSVWHCQRCGWYGDRWELNTGHVMRISLIAKPHDMSTLVP